MLAATAVLVVTPAYAEPDDLVTRPLVLDVNALEVRLTAEINVQARFVGRPLSLSPDAWWGISPRWTIGVIHSSASVDQINAGATFCVRQSDISTCDRTYRGTGLDVRYSAFAGTLALAPRLRVLFRNTDPIKPATTLGALVRWTRGRFAITSDPYLQLPLANRREGNRAQLFVPIWFAVQPAWGWRIALHTGWDSVLATWRDGWHVPVALELAARVTSQLDVGLAAGFPHLLGPQNNVKERAMLVTLEYRPGPP
jgi:hypothetical protein